MARLPIFYSCDRCPAYCCSYDRIIADEDDIRRLAKHFGMSYKKARKTLTKKGEEKGERILRHHKDHIYKSVCQFLDRDTRRCTIYEARPEICREYPGSSRCGYYDFLSFERNAQEDPDFIPDA
ncbi:MAG: YkgJ family cysteine cluster protein [Thermoanaerobaculia bacterium]